MYNDGILQIKFVSDCKIYPGITPGIGVRIMLTIEKRFYQIFKVLALIMMILSGFAITVILLNTALELLSNEVNPLYVTPLYIDALMKYSLIFFLTFCFYKYMYYKQRYFELKYSVDIENKN